MTFPIGFVEGGGRPFCDRTAAAFSSKQSAVKSDATKAVYTTRVRPSISFRLVALAALLLSLQSACGTLARLSGCQSDADCEQGQACLVGSCIELAGLVPIDGGAVLRNIDAGFVDGGFGPPNNNDAGGALRVDAGTASTSADAGPSLVQHDGGPNDGGSVDGGSGRLSLDGGFLDAGAADAGLPPPTTDCGNGLLEVGENCDDHNTNSADGCSSLCQVEPGSACFGVPSFCAPSIDVYTAVVGENLGNLLEDNRHPKVVFLPAGEYVGGVNMIAKPGVSLVGEPGTILRSGQVRTLEMAFLRGDSLLRGITIQNDRPSGGAGLKIHNSNVVIEDCVFGPITGRGIFSPTSGADIVLRRSVVRETGEGAIDLDGNLLIENNFFYRNTPDGRALIKFSGSANGVFRANTVVKNPVGNQKVVDCSASDVNIESSLFVDNDVSNANDFESSCVLLYNTLDFSISDDTNTSLGAIFVDSAQNDFHLAPNTPCLDAIPVATAGPAQDFDQDDRPSGNGREPGADEVN